MRIPCPICGARDLREFSCKGSAALLDRPAPEAGPTAFHAYVHLRENRAGANAELWQHVRGCRAWLRVERDVTTHEILDVRLAREGPDAT